MKLLAIMWSTFIPSLKIAAENNNIQLKAFSNKQISLNLEIIAQIREEMKAADGLLIYRTNDSFWSELESDLEEVKNNKPVLVIGPDPSAWTQGTVEMSQAAEAYRYLLYNGPENFDSLIRYVANIFWQAGFEHQSPVEIPWEGIYHPDFDRVWSDSADYMNDYQAFRQKKVKAWVGLLFSRSNWINKNMAIEKFLIATLEELNLGVIPVFHYPTNDASLGNLGGLDIMEKFFRPAQETLIKALIKMGGLMLSTAFATAEAAQKNSTCLNFLKKLNVPIFGPTISYYQDKEKWLSDEAGLGTQVAWSVAMPEFEGIIEPLVIGASQGAENPENEFYEPLEDRVKKLAARVAAWVKLASKPNEEKKIAFILHNNPCSSVEATVGGGAHLDTLESVAAIMKAMKTKGFQVEPPENGQSLIENIMNKKALAEFRWTTVEEIAEKGGALCHLEAEKYQKWFEELPQETQAKMIEAWGKPPGEEQNGLPSAMVLNNKILITGVRYGNALVLTQPKRGCAGARCDGAVCKILHDPDVPPPHQYVATYKWLAREFKIDALVHVGTHGTLEFLPGKSSGLSSGCFPDIGIDALPHLYIYNADNPPEGTVAKRRSLAVLINHLQTLMASGELYGDLEDLEKLIDDWHKFKDSEPAKAHLAAHLIIDKANEMTILDEKIDHNNFEEKALELHEVMSTYKGSKVPKGLHVFGQQPEGEALSDYIYSIVSYDWGPGSFRTLMEKTLLKDQGQSDELFLQEIDEALKTICRAVVNDGVSLKEALATLKIRTLPTDHELAAIEENILDIQRRIQRSDEIGSILAGFEAQYIEAGPSGLITRGRADILPTGRNFYSLDPYKIPSLTAWASGQKLANAALGKYLAEEGHYPPNIAFYWQCSDLMWADGEGLAQMLFLLGVRPVWEKNGRVKSFSVIPLEELRRPRIDLTIRVSGIIRDNFPAAIELLDEAISSVAALPEPLDMNYVRRHTLEKLNGRPENEATAFREASYRIFASQPGTYQAGTQLAVFASAWKTEEDLAQVFLYWNGYAYGKNTFGAPAHKSLRDTLKTVKLTFNKTVTDEYDLTGCCGHFGTHGGLINAAQQISGKKIKNYYGDTRRQDKVEVRTLNEELRRVARAKILNPLWINGLKEHGYRGAAEISKRVGHLYGWQATSQAVDDSIFDDVTRTFLMDKENRDFFEKENPWALESMSRRLLEAAQRGLWQPAEDVKEALEELYLEIEGWLEERIGEAQGHFQGGDLDVVSLNKVTDWSQKMKELLK